MRTRDGVAAMLTLACAGVAPAQGLTPMLVDPLPLRARAAGATLADLSPAPDGLTARSRRHEITARETNPYLGDAFAAGMLAENGAIAVLLDDPFKNSFIFDGQFQDAGEHFFNQVPTSLGAFFEAVPGPVPNIFQVTVVAVTDDGSDWLRAGLTIPQSPGRPFTILRMDMGMFAADFFGDLGPDAPIQPQREIEIEVISSAFALFSDEGFLGAAPLSFFLIDNRLGGVGAVREVAGAGVNEVQMLFLLQVGDVQECPEDVTVTLPPDGEWHEIDLHEVVGATNPDGSPVQYQVISISQDEPVGLNCPDADGVDSDIARVRAERTPWGNGRVYTIFYQVSLTAGVCVGEVRVEIPPESNGAGAIDDGQSVDSTDCPIPGDITRDGAVNACDLAHLLAAWRTEPPAPGDPVDVADLNEDGRVDSEDLVIVLAQFGSH